MCDIAQILFEDGIPKRGWRRWLWFAGMAVSVVAAGVIVYLAFL